MFVYIPSQIMAHMICICDCDNCDDSMPKVTKDVGYILMKSF